MLCDHCHGEPATVHLSQVVDGEVEKIDLCPTCAHEADVEDEAGMSLANMLADAATGADAADASMNDEPSEDDEELEPNDDDLEEAMSEAEIEEAAMEATCPSCGFTADDFKKTGRLGCASCYGVFEAMMGDTLKQFHKKTTHMGKVPAHLARRRQVTEQLNALQKKLDDAIHKEAFEEAAALRDQITLLEANLKDS